MFQYSSNDDSRVLTTSGAAANSWLTRNAITLAGGALAATGAGLCMGLASTSIAGLAAIGGGLGLVASDNNN